MNVVIGLNVFWVVTQSIIDLNNWEEPMDFMFVDLFFSFIYVLEAVLKLCHWSFAEYWYYGDNRFDLITSVLLAMVGGSRGAQAFSGALSASNCAGGHPFLAPGPSVGGDAAPC